MINGIIAIIVGVLVGSLSGKLFSGVIAKVISYIGIAIVILGLYWLVTAFI